MTNDDARIAMDFTAAELRRLHQALEAARDVAASDVGEEHSAQHPSSVVAYESLKNRLEEVLQGLPGGIYGEHD
ncbi:MAG: hypothetical protein ABI634_00410 [Acidobacteriota bacterium]